MRLDISAAEVAGLGAKDFAQGGTHGPRSVTDGRHRWLPERGVCGKWVLMCRKSRNNSREMLNNINWMRRCELFVVVVGVRVAGKDRNKDF
jgi:hypothetical protein